MRTWKRSHGSSSILVETLSGVKEHFEKLGITDVITQAYYCEVYLEMMSCKSFAGVLKKAGVGVSQKNRKRQRRKKKDREEQDEEAEEEKKFIYDGRFKNALIQLTLKVWRLNLYADRKKIINEAILIVNEIWLMLEEERRRPGGEALDRVTGPLEKRGSCPTSPPPFGVGFLRKQEYDFEHPAPVQAPDTRRHSTNYDI